jgi:hypothetical protein
MSTPKTLRTVLFFWVVAIFIFFIWAYFAQIDDTKEVVTKKLQGGSTNG